MGERGCTFTPVLGFFKCRKGSLTPDTTCLGLPGRTAASVDPSGTWPFLGSPSWQSQTGRVWDCFGSVASDWRGSTTLLPMDRTPRTLRSHPDLSSEEPPFACTLCRPCGTSVHNTDNMHDSTASCTSARMSGTNPKSRRQKKKNAQTTAAAPSGWPLDSGPSIVAT